MRLRSARHSSLHFVHNLWHASAATWVCCVVGRRQEGEGCASPGGSAASVRHQPREGPAVKQGGNHLHDLGPQQQSRWAHAATTLYQCATVLLCSRSHTYASHWKPLALLCTVQAPCQSSCSARQPTLVGVQLQAAQSPSLCLMSPPLLRSQHHSCSYQRRLLSSATSMLTASSHW